MLGISIRNFFIVRYSSTVRVTAIQDEFKSKNVSFFDLLNSDPSAAVRAAHKSLGNFGSSEKNSETWKSFAGALASSDWFALKTTVEIVDSLTSAGFSLVSFWEGVSSKVTERLDDRFGASLKDLLTLVDGFSRINYRHDAAITRLIQVASQDEGIWILEKHELLDVIRTLGRAGVRNRAVFLEIAMRVVEEIKEFEIDELLTILRGFSAVKFSHDLMMRKISFRVTNDFWQLEGAEIEQFARLFSYCRFRCDTFFKSVVIDMIADNDLRLTGKVSDGIVNDVGEMEVETLPWLKSNGPWWDTELGDNTRQRKTKNSESSAIVDSTRIKTIRPVASGREYSVSHIAAVAEAMRVLNMTKDETAWWAKEKDYAELLRIVVKCADTKNLNAINLTEIAGCLAAAKSNDFALFTSLVKRYRKLLHQSNSVTESVADPSDDWRMPLRALGPFLSNLAKIPCDSSKRWLELTPLCEWLCENVYVLEFSEVCAINRALAYMGVTDHNYFKIWVSYYQERLKEASMDDVKNIKDTYNKIKLRDNVIGRDLFYGLGRRYQDLHVSGIDKKGGSQGIIRLG